MKTAPDQEPIPAEPTPEAPKLTPVAIAMAEDAWASAVLADGAMIRVKLVITGVARIEGVKDQFGNQGYSVATATIVAPVMPPDATRARPN